MNHAQANPERLKYSILRHLYSIGSRAKQNKLITSICDECMIGESTFHRWTQIVKFDYEQNIPHSQLQIIARHLQVTVETLIN